MKKLLVVSTILAVMAVTLRTVASLLNIEKMMKRWYKVDFENNSTIRVTLGDSD